MLKSRLRKMTCRIKLKACIKFRRRRLKRLCDGMCGNMSRYSFQQLSSSVSICQPRHSPINAMAISSLSEHSGAGPGRLNKGETCFHTSSTTTNTQVQKSSNSVIISLSSVVQECVAVTHSYHSRGFLVNYPELVERLISNLT